MRVLPLQDLKIIVSRPQAQSECLAKKLSAQGAKVDIIPAIEIHPLSYSYSTQLSHCHFDYGIVTSLHAVKYGTDLIRSAPKTAWIAIGPATADALQALRVQRPVLLPEEYNSEGVLDLPVLQNVQHKNILVITGKAGRTIMQQTLLARGGQVFVVEVYERQFPPAAKYALQKSLKENKQTYLFVTSNQMLQYFFSMLSPLEQAILLQFRLVVASARIALYAKTLGFKKIIVSTNASDSAMIAALKTEVED